MTTHIIRYLLHFGCIPQKSAGIVEPVFFFFRTGFPTGRPVQVGSKGPGCFVSPHVADVVSARQIACAAQKLGCGMWIFDFIPLRYRVADGVYR